MIQVLVKGDSLPRKKYSADAGYDLHIVSVENCELVNGKYVVKPGTYRLRTGIHILIPSGYWGFIVPRSSWRQKGCICQSVIDSGFTGELMPFTSFLQEVEIEPGERVLQLIVLPTVELTLVSVDELPKTERGEAGAGSTGRF